MQSSSPLVDSLLKLTLERLFAAETSAAAFLSIESSLVTDFSAISSTKELFVKSRGRLARLNDLASRWDIAPDSAFDTDLNSVLDDAFMPFDSKIPVGSIPELLAAGLGKIRSYQEKLLTDLRELLTDTRDQELRNWSSEELLQLRREIDSLSRVSAVPLAIAN